MGKVLLDLFQGGQPIGSWHRDVRDDDIRGQRLRGLEQRAAIPNRSYQPKRLGHVPPDRVGETRMVVGQQDAG
jgi:hypothetical protein